MSLSVHPVQSFKNMSTGKKVATAAGVAATVAATAAVATAFVKGKSIAPEAKLAGKLNAGFGSLKDSAVALSKKAVAKFQDAVKFVKSKLPHKAQ